MYRFLLRPKWIGFHLLVLAAVVAMINLGLWQLRRLDQRKDFNAQVTARVEQAPVGLDSLLAEGLSPAEMQWRPVIATGTYIPGEEITIVNRSQDGVAGQNTVSALRLDDGRILLVNRGFTALDDPASPPPAGEVTIEGRLRESQKRRLGQLSDPSDGDLTVAQRVDIDRLAPQLPGEVVPVYLDQVRSSPADGPPPYPVPLPELTEANHLSYAIQWFIFSTAAIVGWFLAVRRSIRARRTVTPPTTASDELPAASR